MKKVICLVGCLLLISGCARNMSEINQKADLWIEDYKGPSSIDITGTWMSSDWGTAVLKQDGNRVSGVLGDYFIKGRITDKTIRMGFYFDTDLYFSVIMDMINKDELKGKYYKYMDYKNSNEIYFLRRKE